MNGTVTYTPEAGYSGDDQFTFIVSDGLLDSDPDNPTVQVISRYDSLVQTLLDLIVVINNLEPGSLNGFVQMIGYAFFLN